MAGFFKLISRLVAPPARKTAKPLQSSQITITIPNPIPFESHEYTPEQSRANLLASQAVKLKDIQINDAIKLLRESYDLWPDNKEIAFRLARYLRQNNERDEAFSIYSKIALTVDKSNYLSFGFDHASIYSEMMKQLFEEKKFNHYLYYHLHELWNTLTGLASQGRYDGIQGDLFLTYGAQTKIVKSLKALSILNEKEVIANEVFNFLKAYDVSLKRLSKISKENEFSSPDVVPLQGSVGEKQNAALSRNKEFLELFERLSCSTIPDQLYKEVFTPRLKDPVP